MKLNTALFSVALSKQVVHYKGHQVHNLNELEYINGEVWANVFMVCLCVINYDFSWRKYISLPKNSNFSYVCMMTISQGSLLG